jgi:hypothetical protein
MILSVKRQKTHLIGLVGAGTRSGKGIIGHESAPEYPLKIGLPPSRRMAKLHAAG